MIQYTLTEEEQKQVLNLIKEINKDETKGTYFRRNPVDRRQSKQEAQKESFGAELAFCRIVGAEPDLTLHNQTILVDVIFKGYKIDVKQTKYKNGKLILKQTDALNSPIDIYVLIVGSFPNYVYKGWCYKNELIKEENLINLGYNNYIPYCLSQEKLRKEEIK